MPTRKELISGYFKKKNNASLNRVSLDFAPLEEMASSITKDHMEVLGKKYTKEVEQVFNSILESWSKKVATTTNVELKQFLLAVEQILQEKSSSFASESQKHLEQFNRLKTDIKKFHGPKGDKGDPGPKGDVGVGLPGPSGSPDTPDQVVEKVNSAQKKVSLSSLEGFFDLIDSLKTEIQKKSGSKKGGGMGNVQHETFSIGTGTTSIQTAYKIAGQGNAIFKSAYNGAELHKGVHYTVGGDSRTITFTSFTQTQFTDDTNFDVTYVRG